MICFEDVDHGACDCRKEMKSSFQRRPSHSLSAVLGDFMKIAADVTIPAAAVSLGFLQSLKPILSCSPVSAPTQPLCFPPG